VIVLAAAADKAGFATSFDPLVWPSLPVWGVIGLLAGAVATLAAPPPPRPVVAAAAVVREPVVETAVPAPELVS
jgi:hypothetical protein